MPLPERKSLGHTPPPWAEAGSVFFVTICAAPRGRNQLCTTPAADVLFEAIQFRQTALRWHVRLALLMPDHLHMLVSFSPAVPMGAVIANFKEHVAKRAGIEWQRDFFDHRLRNDESLDEKAAYIRMNPVRARLVGAAEDWRWVWMPEM